MMNNSPYPATASELLQGMPLTLLGLCSGISQGILDEGINTIYDLLKVDIGTLSKTINGMGKANYTILQETVEQLKAKEWTVDEIAEFRFLHGVTVIPSKVTYPEQKVHVDLPVLFTQIVGKILLEKDERQYTVLKHRFGLNGETIYTLKQLGSADQITRERVRQMEEKAITQLRRVLITGQLSDKDKLRINEFIRIETADLKNEIQ